MEVDQVPQLMRVDHVPDTRNDFAIPLVPFLTETFESVAKAVINHDMNIHIPKRTRTLSEQTVQTECHQSPIVRGDFYISCKVSIFPIQ